MDEPLPVLMFWYSSLVAYHCSLAIPLCRGYDAAVEERMQLHCTTETPSPLARDYWAITCSLTA